jgi:dTDP-4-dehydrorhamnose reductase
MKLFLTGGNGLLGHALLNTFHDWEIVAPASADLDITDPMVVDQVISHTRPHLAIHSAAMTLVDQCEIEPERAYRINVLGTENVARSCARYGVRLVVISSDYVFSGDSPEPYSEDDAPGPRTVYGASKLAAERAVAVYCPDHVIARVSWLFGPGRPCFVDSLVEWGSAAEPSPVHVAGDQFSVPTSTRSVAWALRDVAMTAFQGVVHLTSEGGASRYELARAVFDILHLPRPLEACSLADFGAPARRPHNSRLVSRRLPALGLPPMPPWRDELTEYLTETYLRPAQEPAAQEPTAAQEVSESPGSSVPGSSV